MIHSGGFEKTAGPRSQLTRSFDRSDATPIPVADILPITATQVGLITGIAYLSGRELSKDATKEFLVALGANLGAAFALRELARAVGKIALPIGGELLSAGVAAAGTWGIGIEPSRWLLACGFLLTLFLGFAKRRAELERLAEDAGQHREVLEDYSIAFLDKAVLACAVGMVVTYALYTVDDSTVALHGTESLIWTLPWVLLGAFRYLFRLHYRGGGGDPAQELLRDPLLAAAALGWVATVAWLIG